MTFSSSDLNRSGEMNEAYKKLFRMSGNNGRDNSFRHISSFQGIGAGMVPNDPSDSEAGGTAGLSFHNHRARSAYGVFTKLKTPDSHET